VTSKEEISRKAAKNAKKEISSLRALRLGVRLLFVPFAHLAIFA
jgi:hypothetical protein